MKDDPALVPAARLGGDPTAAAVAGCSPTPAGATTCTDVGGLTRDPGRVVFYQARCLCGTLVEGP